MATRRRSKDLQRLRNLDATSLRFYRSILSKYTVKEIMDLGKDEGGAGFDMLHPETCAWLEGLSKRIKDGDLETRLSALTTFAQGYTAMLSRNETACMNYVSYVLRQGIIVEEVVQGLREMAAKTRVCYLLPKDEEKIGHSGAVKMSLQAINYTYSGILSMFAAEKRTRKYILERFQDIMDVLMRLYEGAAIPEGLNVHSAELQAKLQIGHSILILGKGLSLSKTFLSTMLQDVVAVSPHPRLFQNCVAVLQKSRAFLNLASPSGILTLVTRLLEGSDDKQLLIEALNVLACMLGMGFCTDEMVRREASLLSYVVAIALAAQAVEEFPMMRLAIAILQESHPSLKSENPGLGPDVLAKLESVASNDELARRQKVHFVSVLTGAIIPPYVASMRAGVGRAMEAWGMFDHSSLNPLRKCARTECQKVEAAPREFKVCSRCRFTSYCSVDCQKLAWKQGHKEECKTQKTNVEH